MKLLSSLIVATVSIAAAAQGPANPYEALDRAGAIMAGAKSVQRELRLEPEQQVRLEALYKLYVLGQQKVYRAWETDTAPANAPKFEKQLDELGDTLSADVLKVLSIPQRKRVREIALQQVGLPALVQTGVAADLKLTQAQKSQLQALFRAFDKRSEDFDALAAQRLQAIPKPKDPSGMPEYERKRLEAVKAMRPEEESLERARREMEAKALAVLSQEQRAAWTALLGKPFQMAG